MAKSFKRFQREPSSREPSIWDVYAGQYPQLSAWGAPTYQHWYPYPFTDPNAPQGSTPVSPSEKLGDPGAAAGGAPGGGAGAGGVGAGGGGGVGGAGGVGSPFSGVMPPAVEGTVPAFSGEQGGTFIEPFGGEGVASTPAPEEGDVVGFEPGHAGLLSALALSAIPTPVGLPGLAAELGKVVAGRELGNIVSSNVPRSTQLITPEGPKPAVPTKDFLGLPYDYVLSQEKDRWAESNKPRFEEQRAMERDLSVGASAPFEGVTGSMELGRPPVTGSMEFFGPSSTATPMSVAPTTDPSEAGGIGTVGMGGGDSGSSK